MKTVLKGAYLIQGNGSAPIYDAVVVIDDDKITYVGASDTEIEKDAEQFIDVTGKTIIPGIIDCHVHLCGILSPDVRDWVLEPAEQQAIVSTAEAEKLIKHGVTCVGDVSENGLYLKRLTNTDRFPGPHIFAFGRGLCRTGGYIDCSGLPAGVINEQHPWGILCDNPEAVRKAVRRTVRKNADGIKIWATSSGVSGKPYFDDTDQDYTMAELKMAAEEAKYIKLPVFAHCESIAGTKAALKSGITNIVHGEELDDECLDLMQEKNAVFMPTLKVTLDWLNYDYDAMPVRAGLEKYPGETDKEKEYNRILDNFKKVYERGIKIAVASDTFCQAVTPYGATTLDELKALAQAGMSLQEVITAASQNGADAMEIGKKRGAIEAGKFADLIVLDVPELNDIEQITVDNMIAVYKNGKSIDLGKDGE